MNSENKKLDNEEMEIDLLDLFYVLLGKWHYILICLLAGGILLGAYSYFMIDPTYQSTSKLYVVSSSEDSVVNLTDLNLGTSLTKDYQELILSYPLLNQVIDRLELEISYQQLANMITLTNPSNTRILEILVTTTNPELSRDIANTVAELSSEYLPETMGTIAPNIAQVAQLPQHKSGPSNVKYAVIGAMLGAIIFCGIIVVQYLLDDTIRSAEDLEKHFGIVPLTSIPDSDIFEEYEDENVKQKAKGWKKIWKR